VNPAAQKNLEAAKTLAKTEMSVNYAAVYELCRHELHDIG
jgi:hypothetical protein